ncbi:fibronectin type III domain-containing protein [Streptomyces sp. H39-S7]|uniref:fibronectin type III domain-containing protein n=1 Tax=Streptomyces sp. H39-S7 TaxID=3004357 RepID=UPI0022B06260|nr:fibronectin type III domain-containing protein [Streptomyces sp. H39-S7]MCZ4122347.1 fibronectin type III domain-containing protein [Streptomyces sp. H39-S7]
MIDSVQPFTTGTVHVTVTMGDTAQEPVARVDVHAYALDDNGDPTGAPIANGHVLNPDPANPPVVKIQGLTNDANYAFEATETTAGGALSGVSTPFIGGPQTPKPPLAPTLATVLGRDTKMLVVWNPAHPNGSPVTSYTVTATPNGPGASVTASVAGNAIHTTLTGLVNGKYYSVTVTATNAAGTSPAGTSDSQTVGAEANGTVAARPAYTSSAPQDVSAGPPPPGADGAQPDPTSLQVSWDAPFDNGGHTITNYIVDAVAPGQAPVVATVPATTTRTTLTGLAPDVEYKITVTGTQHNGQLSATSTPVTAAPHPTLAAGTVFLSAASIATITRVTDTTVVFTNPPAQVTNLAVKNIIAVGESTNPLAHSGLLRVVDSKSTTGGTVTLTTSQAALQQAFRALDFTAHGNQATSGAQGYRIQMLNPNFQATMAPQVAIPIANKTFTLDLAQKLNDDPKMKERLGNATITAKLTAALSLTTNWEANASFQDDPNGSWYSTKTFTYDFSATATAKASITGELGIAYKHETQREPLLTLKPAGTGCVIVYAIAFCPSLTIYTQTSIDGSIKFTFNATYERTMGGKVHRDSSGNTHKTDLTKNPVTAFNYDLNAAATVTFAFPVSLKILIYDVAGPELEVTPSIEITADTAATPWLKVTAPLKVSVFFLLDFKLTSFSFGGVVYNTTFPLYQSAGAFPIPSLSSAAPAAATGPRTASKSLTAAAAATKQYAVTWPAACDPAQAVTWSMAAGSLGTVSPTGLYTPPTHPGTNYTDLINATTAGTATCPSVTAQAAHHHGASLPAAPHAPAISPDGSTVTWTAPADGGSAIEEYVVTVVNNPGDPAGSETVLGTAPGTATSMPIPADRIPQIEGGHASVQVTAVTARGQGPASALSPPAPATNPLPVLTTSTAIAGGGNITVTPDVFNLGASDATNVTYQLAYPPVFTNPTAPSSCTINTTSRTLTCDTGAIPAGTDKITPLISFTVGTMTPGTAHPLTITRTGANPYASDPNNGTTTLMCAADTALKVTCA